MNDRLLSLYHRLPPPARSAAATLRGIYLRAWRYGRDSERLEQEALERESWTPDKWDEWVNNRMEHVLHRAATRVPYYRRHWEERRRRGDRSPWGDLSNWPILEKDEVRAEPRSFLADDVEPRRMFHENTSGTTGKPLDLWAARRTVESLYALASARTRAWSGIDASARWARLGGQLVTPVRSRRPPFWVWNAAMRQLYMSSQHLAPDLIPYYLDALVRYRIVWIAGYTSSLYALARECIAAGRTDIRMAAIYTNAEPINSDQRAVIEEAFQCPVRETYGMAETVAAASECEARHLHVWPEVGHIEVHDDNGPVAAGETGKLVCTGLLNPDMPLIRYSVGDRGRLPEKTEVCECGRTLPMIDTVDGRTSDLIVTREGREVFWLNPVFYGLPVRESQIIQETLDRVLVRVSPAPGFDKDSEDAIIHRLRERIGEFEVGIEQVDSVPRTSNGKLRAVVCNLSAAARDAAIRGSGAEAR